MIAAKSQFMLGLCEQLLGEGMNWKHHSIIDRCMKDLYVLAWKEQKTPLMSDFYHILKRQEGTDAQDLALSLELFVEGSLNIFNHHTNVDVDNRFTVYGIQDLGSQLAPVAMLVMMETIQKRIIDNGRKGRATWLYIDECHVLLNSKYSAEYLEQLWKKVRKQGGLCTGITQNITDLLNNPTAISLLSNSEFVALLKQGNVDSGKLEETIGVTDAQLQYVSNTLSGMGLLKCGSIIIPFDNRIGKDSELYQLYNTNIHEKIAMGLVDAAGKPSWEADAGELPGEMEAEEEPIRIYKPKRKLPHEESRYDDVFASEPERKLPQEETRYDGVFASEPEPYLPPEKNRDMELIFPEEKKPEPQGQDNNWMIY